MTWGGRDDRAAYRAEQERRERELHAALEIAAPYMEAAHTAPVGQARVRLEKVRQALKLCGQPVGGTCEVCVGSCEDFDAYDRAEVDLEHEAADAREAERAAVLDERDLMDDGELEREFLS